MARTKIKYATPRVFNIDQARKILVPLRAVAGVDSCNNIRLYFNDNPNPLTSFPDEGDFIVSLSGGAAVVTFYMIYSAEGIMDLYVDRIILDDETGTVTYTPGVHPIYYNNGLLAPAFTIAVTNNSTCSDTTTTTEGPGLGMGYLYNWYAVDDARNICAVGFHVPTDSDWNTLFNYISDINTCSNELKEVGVEFWTTATGLNTVGFNARGGGYRSHTDGTFVSIKILGAWWTSSISGFSTSGKYVNTFDNADDFNNSSFNKKRGISIRPIRDSTILTHGQIGTYVGNDGKVYRTICIGNQEWVADNLCETLYRDGSPIPEEIDNAAWVALETGARCSYNNDEYYSLD